MLHVGILVQYFINVTPAWRQWFARVWQVVWIVAVDAVK